MFRMCFAVALVIAVSTAGTSRADTLPLFNDVPNIYIPGTPFTFQITLPDSLNGVSSYNIGLVFDAAVVNPALSATAAPPASGYVFPTTTGFTPNPSNSFAGPGPNEVSLSFSDSIAPNFVSTMPGQDILATITVNPDISLTGPITVSFTGDTSVSYFTEGFDTPQGSVTIDQGTPPPAPVPTPSGWLSLAIGGLILVGRNRLQRAVKLQSV
jgi:hypothetical protein